MARRVRRREPSGDELAAQERRDRMLLHYAWVPHRFDEDADTWGGHDAAICPGYGCARTRTSDREPMMRPAQT